MSLVGLFRVEHDYPAIEPPEYLRRISPRVYEAERRRIAARFNEAATLAEEAFTDEFAKLVEHLSKRLGSYDGKPRVFRGAAIGNLNQFFERFTRLRSGLANAGDLDRLVNDARSIVAGVRPKTLRNNASVRERIASDLVSIQSQLDGLMVDRPRRNTIRPNNETKAARRLTLSSIPMPPPAVSTTKSFHSTASVGRKSNEPATSNRHRTAFGRPT